MSLYVALLHHPVRDRGGEIITTAVTNLDVHDIARTARTYDAAGYFVVTPIAAQRELVERILAHWREGPGARRVPERSVALAACEPLACLDDAVARVRAREGAAPALWATAARPVPGRTPLPFAAAAEALGERPTLILFGTGHGLAPEVIERADALLPPVRGGASYNHLSVRAAVAVVLDRLRGERRAAPGAAGRL